MSKQTKIIIGVVAGVLVLCIAICLISGLWVNALGKNITGQAAPNPEKAAQSASEIADFTPMNGFQPVSSLSILGYNMVIYSGGDQSPDVMILMQMPGNMEINDSTIQQMQKSMEQQSGRQMNNIKTIESRDLTIREKPARMIIQEGENENGATVRQMMLAFQGKGGIAMLMYASDASAWDQAAVDQMVESVR